MLIADAQVHIWAASTPERPWPQGHGTPDRPVPFGKDDLLREMDAVGVQRAVLVGPSWDGNRNDLVLAAARMHPDRFGVMGRFDDRDPAAKATLREWRKQPGMLGLRLTFRTRELDTEDWLWSGAEVAGVPLLVGVYGDFRKQFRALGEVAARHPSLRISICHFGIQRGLKDHAAFAHLDCILPLARFPNVAVNATSLQSYVTGVYPFVHVHPYLRQIYDAYGPARMFWGTDFTRMRCTYQDAIEVFTHELAWLSEEDRRLIMGTALCKWLDWS